MVSKSRTFLHSLGRKRTFDFVDFGVPERPLWRKADILEYPQDVHKIDQLGTAALRWWPQPVDATLYLIEKDGVTADEAKKWSRVQLVGDSRAVGQVAAR